jgi:hypothetical protein
MDRKRRRRRRLKLLEKDPHCYWCRRELRELAVYPIPKGGLPPDAATTDHLNSRIAYPDGRPRTFIFVASPKEVWFRTPPTTVLSCPRCNLLRAQDEERGIVWTPGCRAGAYRSLQRAPFPVGYRDRDIP